MVTLVSLLNSACSGVSLIPKPSFGAVIAYEVMLGSAEKRGVDAITDEGRRLFGPAGMRPPTAPGRVDGSGGVSSFVGASVPKWVDVSWREGKFVLDKWNPETKTLWKGGTVVAKHRLQIASRIPPEVLKYASGGRSRAIYLIFRLKDDGVLLAWSVQESVRHPSGGSGYVFSLFGGDFTCDQAGISVDRKACTSGYLKDAPWYNPLWITD